MPPLSHYYYSNRHTPTPTPPPISPPFSPSPSMYGPPIPPPGRNSWARSPIYPPYYYPSSSDSETTTPPPPPAASQLTQHFSSPNPFPAQKDATSLPSRVAALNRRAALVAKNLEHLTQVVKPLESVKAADVGMNHLRDVHTEGVELIQALHAFEDQTLEVMSMLGDLLKSRRDQARKREVECEGDWEDEWHEGYWRTKVRGRRGAGVGRK